MAGVRPEIDRRGVARAGSDGASATALQPPPHLLTSSPGNLTLVNGRLNPSLSNAPWNRKREALADHSVMFLNKRLVNDGPDTWDEQAIEDRAKWLHERAVEVWPHADGFDAGSQSA